MRKGSKISFLQEKLLNRTPHTAVSLNSKRAGTDISIIPQGKVENTKTLFFKLRQNDVPLNESTNINHEVRDNRWNNVNYRGDINHTTNNHNYICCLEITDEKFIDKKQRVCVKSPEKVLAGFLFCLILYKLCTE